MAYSSMVQGAPQMGLLYDYDMSQRQPTQAYPYPYGSDSSFLMSQIPPPQQHRTMAEHQSMVHAKQTEPKPRLAKEEVMLLEQEFQKNPKPSSQRKREIADLLKVDNPRINNWFQNRRAKAKQMLRREADPRAAGDESPSESSPADHHDDPLVSEYYGSNQQSMPLRASSATFPAMEQPPLSMFAPTTDGSTMSHGTSPSGDDYSSPGSGSYDMTFSLHNFLTPAPAPAAAPAPEHHGVSNFEQSMDAYVPFTTSSMDMESMMAQVGSLQTADFLAMGNGAQPDKDLMVMPSCEVQQLDPNHLQVSSPGASDPADSGLRLRSPPPPANLATRRNKGAPTLLNSAAFRNGVSGPKTALDLSSSMSKRVDGPGGSIRRIASATGLASNRIQKHSGAVAPRSPLYLEHNQDALLQSLQTATATAGPMGRSLSNTESPMTPSEAFLASLGPSSDDDQFMSFDAASAAAAAVVAAVAPQQNGLPLQGPADHQAAWTSYGSNDDTLLTPSLGSFGSDEFAMMQAAPGYIINSQPTTPSVAQAPGHQYAGLQTLPTSASSLLDYAFPANPSLDYLPRSSANSSLRLSTNSTNKQFQFTPNTTPQDYSIGR